MGEALHPVAKAYLDARRAGANEIEAHGVAAFAYRAGNPDGDKESFSQSVMRILADTTQEPPWLLWEGVDSGARSP